MEYLVAIIIFIFDKFLSLSGGIHTFTYWVIGYCLVTGFVKSTVKDVLKENAQKANSVESINDQRIREIYSRLDDLEQIRPKRPVKNDGVRLGETTVNNVGKQKVSRGRVDLNEFLENGNLNEE